MSLREHPELGSHRSAGYSWQTGLAPDLVVPTREGSPNRM